MPNINGQNSDIRKILDTISSKNGMSKFKDADVEFEIGEEVKAPEPIPNINLPEEKAEETAALNIFDIAEAEEGAALSDDVFKVQAVYIPRFTEASDDYRRLGYIPEKKKNEEPLAVSKTENYTDATAEIDSGLSPDAKIVEVSTEEKELIDESTSMVFKFEQPKPELPKDEPLLELVPEENKPNTEPLAEEIGVSEKEDSEEPRAQEPIIIDEPLVKKLPERYVPTNVAKRENIGKIGDELDESLKSEYKSGTKRDSFKDKFLDKRMSQRLRLTVSAILALVLLIFENIHIFGLDLISLFHFDAMPEALAIIDLQVVICIYLLALPELLTVFKDLISKKVTADIFMLPAFAVYVFYTITVIMQKPSEYPLMGLLAICVPISSVLGASLKTSADFEAFKMISSPQDKKIVDNKFTRTLSEENMALDGLIEEYKSRCARVWDTGFVADFFRRSKRTKESPLHILSVFLVSLGVASVCGLVTLFVYDGFLSFAMTFALVFLLSLPSLTLLSHKLPMLHASVVAGLDNGALIGETAFYDYAGVDVVAFDDTEAFDSEDVNIQRIMLYGNNENLTKALSQMASLFVNVGGPLDIIFSQSQDRTPIPANGVSIYENGIIGEIDGKKIMAGTYDFMLSEGVDVPDDKDAGKKSHDSTKIMYAAENGEVYAKFYIRYRFSEEFTMLIPSLREEGIIPLIYTRDPNISNELLKTLTAGIGVIRVLKKYTTPSKEEAPSKISAGMVSNGDKSNLINLLTLAKKYVKYSAAIKTAEQIALVSGAVISVVFCLIDRANIPSVLLLLWQLGWVAGLLFSSAKFFAVPKKVKKRKKKEKSEDAE